MGLDPRARREDVRMDLARWGFDDDAVALVTGAASGIGRATALRGAQAGLRVAAWDVDEAGLTSLAAEIAASGGTVATSVVDIFDDTAIDTGFTAIEHAWAPVQHLVNNAGPRSVDPHTFRGAIDMAVGSMEAMIQRFLAADPGPHASVVSVSSVAGNVTGSNPPWYPTAKAAIAGLTRALAWSQGKRCRFNAVAPSLVATPRMTSYMESDTGKRWAEENPLGRWADGDDVARVILFLLSPFASYVNGVLLPVDGGQTLNL
jgi:NAD(P)-dependent dehydrogenase (short-subunit alcohol dehydrogenase family)